MTEDKDMTEEIEVNGKKYEVHTCLGGDCGYSQGEQCAFFYTECSHMSCSIETRSGIRDVIFIEKQT